MAIDTFLLDHKVYMPRMRRFGKRIDPYIPPWRQIKDAIRDNKPINWEQILKKFRVGDLLCPQKLKPASSEEHLSLKGIYAFFQHGYIVRKNNFAALHTRVDKRQRITTGHSILLSSTPTCFHDHNGGLSELAARLKDEKVLGKPKPFAVGFSELHTQGTRKYPAYVWLLHEVPFNGDLSGFKRRDINPEQDSFVGMKDLNALNEGKVRCNNEPAKITGAFDRLLIEMLAGGLNNVTGKYAAIRRLRSKEIGAIPREEFKKRNETLRRRLTMLGIMTLTIAGANAIAGTLQGADSIQENLADVIELILKLVPIIAKYF